MNYLLEMVFPIAGITLSVWVVLLIGFGGGVISNIFGIGGGVFVTPILVMMDVPPVVACPSQLQNTIGTSLMGFFNHWRRYDVDLALAGYFILGGIVGAFFGFFIYNILENDPRSLQKFNFLYISVLTIMGCTLMALSTKVLLHPKRTKGIVTMKKWMIYLPFHQVFMRARVEISVLLPLIIGCVAGILTSLLGGGVSMIVMPSVAYLIGRASPVVAGTARLTSFVLAFIVSLIQSHQYGVCDFWLVLFLFAGSTLGANVGRKITRIFPAPYIGIMGAFAILLLSSQLLYRLFVPVKIVAAPTPKIHSYDISHLYTALSFATHSYKKILTFAIHHPTLYTLSLAFTLMTFVFFLEYMRKFLKK